MRTLRRFGRQRTFLVLSSFLLPPLLAHDVPDRRALFEYDRAADLAVVQLGTEHRGNVRIHDITFAATPGSPPAEHVAAFLVEPNTDAPRPAVLWGHWLGEPETSNRTQFLDEAVALAERGVTSLLIEAMWSNPQWYRDRVLEEDFERGVRQVIQFRRALDLLLAQPDIDPSRVAFVGHDYSAMYGSVALAVDRRVQHAVFIAATPSFNDWAFYVKKPASMDVYLAQNRPLDLRDFLARLHGMRVLLQFAGDDFYVPRAKADEFTAAIAAEKDVRWYQEAKHEMTHPPTIRIDREAWLLKALEQLR